MIDITIGFFAGGTFSIILLSLAMIILHNNNQNKGD